MMKSLLCVVLALGCFASAQAAAVSERKTFELVPQDSSIDQCVLLGFGAAFYEGLQSVKALVTICQDIPVFGLLIAPVIAILGAIVLPGAVFLDMLICLGVIHG
ncbi:hypothetical protein FOCC_FOCC005446 [Frankliniella occidentalis]|uniref:Uncharacterized protein LOC127749256 n=1 Tax=Frankliniella occidentalis TaxID=133901 RepID=A0A9C6U6G8_FRAOC|nr:uncharacterized protein LOC127749256 [Frankliniella occidentalis]KAE8747834.1 hypothetical protein FOCC_FOCC005446 [Frankliniella occidentalis]